MSAVHVPGVDLDTLARWMDARGLGVGPLAEASLITGGTQNVLLRFTRAGRTFVLRRPPVHKRANSDETMRREARVLAALAGSDVPHPGLIAAEPDPEVMGAAFYLMEPVDGFNPTLGLPAPFEHDTGWQHAMGLSMADAIVALAAVDHVAVGLGDLGRFDGWAARQVGRWRAQLDSYHELPGYTGPNIPGVGVVGEWLAAHLPVDVRPGVMHGDFHFGNVLIRRDRPAVAAMVDWELATIGDPLLDLGHLLATWPANDGIGVSVAAPGLPSRDDVIERYAAQVPRPLDDLLWYRVLACYRLGLILEGTHARACAGLAPKETGDQLHAHTVSLLEQALTLIG
ncbi:MAG TPA: phosphotransferase family protein [Ilumatobacteraceae bacterium]|nr:phosphotransferase family protein [Ilumatobacteraceae bacterium]HRC46133.1 phosphotransferase family protein [Ilumatobacteraceae bacterium]